MDPRSVKDHQPPCARNAARAVKPEIFVAVGTCTTHLSCSPSNAPAGVGNPSLAAVWPGGFFCHRHGTTFDGAGRVYKNRPAPTNLELPPYRFASDAQLLIGDAAARASAASRAPVGRIRHTAAYSGFAYITGFAYIINLQFIKYDDVVRPDPSSAHTRRKAEPAPAKALATVAGEVPSLVDLQERATEAAALLKALANPDRLMLMCQLVSGERSVSDLGSLTGIEQPSLSQQLGVLRGERLVDTRREGKHVVYRIASPAAMAVLEALYALFCAPGAPPLALRGRSAAGAPGLNLRPRKP